MDFELTNYPLNISNISLKKNFVKPSWNILEKSPRIKYLGRNYNLSALLRKLLPGSQNISHTSTLPQTFASFLKKAKLWCYIPHSELGLLFFDRLYSQMLQYRTIEGLALRSYWLSQSLPVEIRTYDDWLVRPASYLEANWESTSL